MKSFDKQKVFLKDSDTLGVFLLFFLLIYSEPIRASFELQRRYVGGKGGFFSVLFIFYFHFPSIFFVFFHFSLILFSFFFNFF